MNKKGICIEKPFPYELLDDCIKELLVAGGVDKDNLQRNIEQYFSGKNRSRKACNSLYSTITRGGALQDAIKNNFTADTFDKLLDRDRKVIELCLICQRFPFVLDVMNMIARSFNTQDCISTKQLYSLVAQSYGASHGLKSGLEAVTYFLLNAKILKRQRVGLYGKCERLLINLFAQESFLYTWYLFNNKRALVLDDLTHKPIMKLFIFNEERLLQGAQYFKDLILYNI